MDWDHMGCLFWQISEYPPHTHTVSYSVGLDRVPAFAFVTSSQMMLMLLVWEPHFENHDASISHYFLCNCEVKKLIKEYE